MPQSIQNEKKMCVTQCVCVCDFSQVKMVSNMKEAFGNMLLTDYIDGKSDRSSLPSPEVKSSHKKDA